MFLECIKQMFKNATLDVKYLSYQSYPMSQSVSTQEFDDYTGCQICHNTLPHCHCMCPYCGERDKCECALFDAATGG